MPTSSATESTLQLPFYTSMDSPNSSSPPILMYSTLSQTTDFHAASIAEFNILVYHCVPTVIHQSESAGHSIYNTRSIEQVNKFQYAVRIFKSYPCPTNLQWQATRAPYQRPYSTALIAAYYATCFCFESKPLHHSM